MNNSSTNAPARQGVSTFLDFLSWEKASRDTIDFKKVYVDMTGDIIAGLFLSQLLYWHLPNKKGEDKLRILREGKMWLAKSAPEWWDECRISPRELDRAKKSLVGIGLIETRVWKFGGKPTTHFHLNSERFMLLWALALAGELERDKHAFKKDGRAGKKVGVPFHESVITNLGTSLNAAPFHESVETKSRIGNSVLTDPLNQSHGSVASSTETPLSENTQRISQRVAPAGASEVSPPLFQEPKGPEQKEQEQKGQAETELARLLWRARRRVFKRVGGHPPGAASLERMIQDCMKEIQAEDAKGKTL